MIKVSSCGSVKSTFYVVRTHIALLSKAWSVRWLSGRAKHRWHSNHFHTTSKHHAVKTVVPWQLRLLCSQYATRKKQTIWVRSRIFWTRKEVLMCHRSVHWKNWGNGPGPRDFFALDKETVGLGFVTDVVFFLCTSKRTVSIWKGCKLDVDAIHSWWLVCFI